MPKSKTPTENSAFESSPGAFESSSGVHSATANKGAPVDPSLTKALECAKAAIEKRGENIRVLDLSTRSGFTDYFVIVSGMSDRQVQAIFDGVSHSMRTHGHELLSSEGYSEGRWVLMDYGDVIVHIFLDALREYYDLERLWSDAPKVRIPPEFYGPAASREI